MNNPPTRIKFMIGNILLALALITLLFMGSLSDYLGVWAMGLWMGLAGVGIYFIMTDKSDPAEPD